MRNIVLIGMPGCGKSTVGVVLAKALGMDFVDSDLVIQSTMGATLAQLIEQHGTDQAVKVAAGYQAVFRITHSSLLVMWRTATW